MVPASLQPILGPQHGAQHEFRCSTESDMTGTRMGRRRVLLYDVSLSTPTEPGYVRLPKVSMGSASSCAAEVGAADTVPGSALGTAFSFFGAAAAGFGAGGLAFFLESNEPICSCDLYFFRIPSLWYFQNCFDASLPATRWRTVAVSPELMGLAVFAYSSFHLNGVSAVHAIEGSLTYPDARPETWSSRRRRRPQ